MGVGIGIRIGIWMGIGEGLGSGVGFGLGWRVRLGHKRFGRRYHYDAAITVTDRARPLSCAFAFLGVYFDWLLRAFCDPDVFGRALV